MGPIGLLYVNQREMAVVASHDKNVTIIGSDDATTCIIVIVRHLGNYYFSLPMLNVTNFNRLHQWYIFIIASGSGTTALAHLDGNGIDEACLSMITRVQDLSMGYPEGRIELQLIGGYREPNGYADELFYNIMRKSLI